MISTSNLCKSYKKDRGQVVNAADHVSLDIAKGEFVAITGPSGSGKSTLLNIIGLLDIPDSGTYTFQGREVSAMTIDELAHIRNLKMGFVFQQFHLLPRTTAKDNVELPLLYSRRSSIAGLSETALEKVGLKDRMQHTPAELSGGEQQRVAIARALINEPDILLADEPTGNLDARSGVEIMDILRGLNERGTTIVLITHDMHIASFADRVLTMVDGKLPAETMKVTVASSRTNQRTM